MVWGISRCVLAKLTSCCYSVTPIGVISRRSSTGACLTLPAQFPATAGRGSGFPFDDQDFEREGSHSFRSQLDDLAKRHPEFAEHLNFGSGFPFRSHTLGRHRRGSDLNTENPSGSHEAEFRRHADRPFGSRFEQFGFPFSRHFDDEPDYYYADQTPPQAQGAQPEQKQKEPSSPQPTTDKPPQPPQSQERGRKQNIQQSNTVDLGQKQDPVDENRSQRSMSAPPENRSSGQRFISSINIPIQRPGGGDMGARTSQPQPEPQSQPQPQTQNRPNERVIPIHVEGRDEPVIPKNVNTPHSASPQPQTERIFGRAPGHFTQFLNKGEPHGLTPEEVFRQQQQQYQKPHTYHQQQQSQQQPTQQHQQPTQQQQQPTQQQQQPTQQQHQPTQQQPTQQQNQEQEPQFQEQAQQKSCKPSQFDQIQIIQKDVSELMNKVEKFAGKPRDKQYLYLDEMLTRNLIKLDNIETEGKDNIRQARKEAIKCIEGCIGILEAKANANAAAAAAAGQGEEVMDSERSAESQPTSETEPSKDEAATPSTELIASEKQHAMETDPAGLEVSGIVRSGSVVNTNAETTPMEVAHADSGTNGTDIQPATDKAEAQPSTGNVQSEPQESKETQSDSTNKGEGESPSTVINPEQTPEVKLEQQGEVKVENMEVTQGAEASQDVEKQSEGGENAEEKKEEKKEKKKGKKKEKTEKK